RRARDPARRAEEDRSVPPAGDGPRGMTTPAACAEGCSPMPSPSLIALPRHLGPLLNPQNRRARSEARAARHRQIAYHSHQNDIGVPVSKRLATRASESNCEGGIAPTSRRRELREMNWCNDDGPESATPGGAVGGLRQPGA